MGGAGARHFCFASSAELRKDPAKERRMSDSQPENLSLQILRDMRKEMGEMRAEMANKDDIADLRSEMHALRADVASHLLSLDNKIDVTRKELSEQRVALRRAVAEHHRGA
jgi:hypothetical protein